VTAGHPFAAFRGFPRTRARLVICVIGVLRE
jgi:hypothetical protein